LSYTRVKLSFFRAVNLEFTCFIRPVFIKVRHTWWSESNICREYCFCAIDHEVWGGASVGLGWVRSPQTSTCNSLSHLLGALSFALYNLFFSTSRIMPLALSTCPLALDVPLTRISQLCSFHRRSPRMHCQWTESLGL
jgi:hypothetical protein